MKLFHAAASPFVRKVQLVAHERGLQDGLELVSAAASPVKRDAAVVAHNPAGKIPTLLLNDGTVLYDNRVICEYLDSLPGGPRMFPAEGTARWRALTLNSLADEMMGAAVLLRHETFLRPEPYRWPEWIDGQYAKIETSLAHVEERWADDVEGPITIGVLAVACGLGHLDLRYADRPWRDTHPRLAAWYEGFAQRPSMKATTP